MVGRRQSKVAIVTTTHVCHLSKNVRKQTHMAKGRKVDGKQLMFGIAGKV